MIALAVLNQKGGTGKTTVGTNLAAAAHLAGLRTLVIDLDRQGSAVDWAATRSSTSKLVGLTVVKWDKPLGLPRFREIAAGYEVVVLDGPPRLGDIVRTAAVAADVVVIPCQPSGTDIWALPETVDVLDQADAVRAELSRPATRRLFLLNRTSDTRLSRAAPETLAEAGEVCPVSLRNRIAYAAAVTAGESVLTLEPGGAAAHEVAALFAYITQGVRPCL
jgi:chromosome partitioning protein